MQSQGYLWHGSSNRYEILKPHQADDFLNVEGCKHGVYATSEKDVATAFALGVVPDQDGNASRVIIEKKDQPIQMVFFQGQPNLGGKGYLYKLSTNGFVNVGGPIWLSETEVKPIEIIEINVDDYTHLFRYSTKEDHVELERITKQI